MATATVPTPQKPKPEIPSKPDFFWIMREGMRLWKGKSKHEGFSGAPQILAVQFIACETYGLVPSFRPGFDKTKPKEKTAPPQFSRAITTRELALEMCCSEANAVVVLNDAKARGILTWYTPAELREENRKRYKAEEPELTIGTGKGHPQGKHYRLLVENWANVPEYVPPGLEVEEKPAEPEPDLENDRNAIREKPIPLDLKRSSTPRTIQPGAKKYAFSLKTEIPNLVIEPVTSFGVLWFQVMRQDQVFTPEKGAINRVLPYKPTCEVVLGSDIRANELIANLKTADIPCDAELARRILTEVQPCPDLEQFYSVFRNERARKEKQRQRLTTADLLWIARKARKTFIDAQRAAPPHPKQASPPASASPFGHGAGTFINGKEVTDEWSEDLISKAVAGVKGGRT